MSFANAAPGAASHQMAAFSSSSVHALGGSAALFGRRSLANPSPKPLPWPQASLMASGSALRPQPFCSTEAADPGPSWEDLLGRR